MLDQDTRYNFEKDYTSETFPTCDSLISFVECKCKILQINSVSGGNSSKSSSSPARNSKAPKNTSSKVKLHSFVGSNVDSCLSCSKLSSRNIADKCWE
ncbi:hypothetical protein O3M35_012616 [Rhynocoris fuscipes]|uniref:Uncharacterized protein n=1 Tax=Rhynocoris fuscipes TaxID=488301 RepID=A0AAW1CZG0_9HEMI